MRKNIRKLALHTAGLAAVAALALASLSGTGTDPAHADAAKTRQSQSTADLKEGSRGEAVKDLQRALNKHGHHLAVDGIFGPDTKAAVTDFQRTHHLAVDGIAGPQTRSALTAADYTAAESNNPAPAQEHASPAAGGYYLEFTKNWQHPMWSKLSLVHDGKVVKSYRAGSGTGVTDECASGKGWLPNGTYKIKGHETNHSSGILSTGIKGYAIQLEDKLCKPKPGHHAVERNELFIHSEMLSNGTQAPDTILDDDYWRWNGNMDYTSWGCIKLSPTDIKDLFSRLDQANWPKNLTLHVN